MDREKVKICPRRREEPTRAEVSSLPRQDQEALGRIKA